MIQPTLLPQPATVERVHLGDGAWVDIGRGWLADDGGLFERLCEHVPWRHERRPMYDRIVDVPRLVAHYEAGEPWPDPMLYDLRDRLNLRYAGEIGEDLVTCGLCRYRTGQDSVAWHGDTIGRARHDDTVVAVLSLGAERTFALRRRGGGPSMRVRPGHGDLLVMGGTCQRTWEHAVPKTARAVGQRLSVQFRTHGVR